MTGGTALPSLERRNLRQQTTQIIRLEITTGRIAPGEIFSATHFARELGISVTPVREALLDLVNHGLLEVVRNRGFRAPVLSQDAVADLLEVRALLEIPAIGLAAEVLSSSELGAAEDRAMETVHAAEIGDDFAFIEADVQFHEELLNPLPNKKLVGEIHRLRDQTRLYSLRELGGGASLIRKSASEHVALVSALKSRDSSAARTVMAQHLQWISHPDPGRSRMGTITAL